MEWRIINSGKRSPAWNMAADEAIFNSIIAGESPPTIRFYDWSPPTLSYGYNQEVEKEIDFEQLIKYNFGYVRRPTGGRMVLHYEEVTYSVISPLQNRLSGSILETYSEISTALLTGLKNMGVAAKFEKKGLSTEQQRRSANPCFTSSSRFELNYKHSKIVGSAQVRKNNTLLQHGSILLHHDQSLVAEFIPGLSRQQRERFSELLKKKTVAINQIIPQPKSYDEAVSHFISAFQEEWKEDKCKLEESLTKKELLIASDLEKSKYGSTVWNKRK